jgi:hypothetical protein
MAPRTTRFLATSSGVPPPLEISSTVFCVTRRHAIAPFGAYLAMASLRALANLRAVEIHAGHPGLRGEGNEGRVLPGQFAAAQSVFLLSQARRSSGPPAFRRRSKPVARRRPIGFSHAGRWIELRRLAIAQRDRAGFVEQQNVHVAGSLDRPAGHGDHVALDHAVHARDADGRQQAADGGGNQADQQETSTKMFCGRPE